MQKSRGISCQTVAKWTGPALQPCKSFEHNFQLAVHSLLVKIGQLVIQIMQWGRFDSYRRRGVRVVSPRLYIVDGMAPLVVWLQFEPDNPTVTDQLNLSGVEACNGRETAACAPCTNGVPQRLPAGWHGEATNTSVSYFRPNGHAEKA